MDRRSAISTEEQLAACHLQLTFKLYRDVDWKFKQEPAVVKDVSHPIVVEFDEPQFTA